MYWRALRYLIYERDQGICAVCHTFVSLDRYECGHIVDRCAGGADVAENLVVMCYACNRFKPVHETADAFWAWVRAGGWRGDFLPTLAAIHERKTARWYRLNKARAIVDQDENELYSVAELKALGISQHDRRRLAALHTRHANLSRDEAIQMVLEGRN